MTVDATTGTATPYASMQMGTGVAKDKTSMGNQQFLNLLVTQLKYQDPSAPMDSAAILQQTSAMTTVEQMIEQTTTAREAFGLQLRSTAAAFVGQQVTWTDQEGTTRSGTVDSASFADATPVLNVGGVKVPVDSVSLIQPRAAAAAATPATGTPAATAPATTTPATATDETAAALADADGPTA